MNLRERFLLGTLLGVLIVGGCGALFYYVLFLPYKELGDQVADEQRKLNEKQVELRKEKAEAKRITDQDPRLEFWKALSLPEPAGKEEAPAAKGRTAEDVTKRINPMQRAYQDRLEKILLDSHFQGSTLQVVPQSPDTKGPVLTGKTPVYTRLPFAVTGHATWGSVVEMLEKFHKEPLLHEVKSLRLLRPATRQTAQAADQPAGPGGPQGPGGRGPGAGGPQGPGGRGPGGRGDPRQELLDVRMTVEVLMVNGAEHRDSLLPDLASDKLHVLAGGERHYPDLVVKDMFHGKVATDDPASRAAKREPTKDVLEHVKLTMIAYNGRRWYATLYDQGSGDERPVSTVILPPEIFVNDMYGNRLLEGKLVLIDASQLVFQITKIEPKQLQDQTKDKYFRVRLGEMLWESLERPLGSADLKELGITPKDKEKDAKGEE
jgi:hypothetical protein